MSIYGVMHFGAWLPVWAWADDHAWDRLIEWADDNCDNFADRLIVTPRLGNQLESPQGLKKITQGKARINSQQASTWVGGGRPVVFVWPEERTVQKLVCNVAGLPNQSIILLEQAHDGFPSFQGWADAVGAFNADTGENEHTNPDLDEQLGQIFTWYENELGMSPASAKSAYGSSAEALQEKLKELRASGYDEDYIVSYAIALGYPHDLKRLRKHYQAARPE
jgi:hypothetical protein